MAKSLVQTGTSEKTNSFHEHEIFEMMRSRHLYQMQFDLQKRLEKRIRAIELAEKVHISTFQSRKTVFLNKMREKIRQKSLKRYSKEIEKHDERGNENLMINDCSEQDTNEKKEEVVHPNVRPKSMAQLIKSEGNEETVIRPVTSRSVVSLHGKSFPVAKTSAVKQVSDKTLVTEATLYPSDFIQGPAVDEDETSIFSEILLSKDTRFNIVNDTSFRKEKIKSLPPINTDVIKSLATFEMGTLTPDGHLLLTRDDYNDYMSKFEKKREKRLHRVQRLSASLDQKVREFRIEEEDY